MTLKKQIDIFIVEDNKTFALALKTDIETAFLNMPIKLHSFITGETCMDKFEIIKPQIVILDYHLDSRYTDAMDGIKVLDLMKKENNETYVIMLTGDDNIEIALKSYRHGACDYVVKSDTQFRKIIYSLFNIFRIIDSKVEAKRYKNMVIGICLGIAVIVGVVIAIQIFAPNVFI
ncbi:MAG: hypothetical protein A2033_12430 [Bacteroidetes bacterium GWA2_31_9]|nr:MAG: hypothetical protein A2033_12430 [Bacteroidetes bacterium GWA2_31_9]